MSKLDELRKKLEEKKKVLQQETEVIEELNTEEVTEETTEDNYYVVHDIIQDPSTKSRKYLMVEIKYNINTGECKLGEIKNFTDKTTGFSVVSRKHHFQYLYNKCKGVKNDG